MGFYVGIDLGTTNSTVTVICTDDEDDNPLECMSTRPIYQFNKNRADKEMGEKCLPSALYFDIEDKHIYTGKYAKNMYASGDRPMQTVRSVKTRIGGESAVEIPGILNPNVKESFDMIQCSALFIRTIINSLKEQYPDEDVEDEAVVTVPAAFSVDERVATKNAVLLGGFKQCYIMDEPSAALLSYMNSELCDENYETTYKLVYDIGGGTLDVCVAEVVYDDDNACYDIDVKGLSERMNLGGDDFDQLLGAYYLKEFEETEENISIRSQEDQNRIIARIVSNAEDDKIKLNEKIKACADARRLANVKHRVSFELIDDMYVTGFAINKEKLDDIYSSFTNPNNGKLVKPIYTALSRAGLHKDDIDEVIITGGMSNFYAVTEVLEKFFGEDIPIQMVEDTSTAVSQGAALYHWGMDEDNISEDVNMITINECLANNVYIRRGDEFELLISEDMEERQGTFEYKIEDEFMTTLPLFLYSGSDTDEFSDNTASYTQLSGQIFKLQHSYEVGDVIRLTWEIDDDKVVTIGIAEPGFKEIRASQFYTAEQIENNLINQYKLN